MLLPLWHSRTIRETREGCGTVNDIFQVRHSCRLQA